MYKQLTSEQRYTISALLQKKTGIKEIASVIGVHVSTVYRELHRNHGSQRVDRGNPRNASLPRCMTYHYSHGTASEQAAVRKRRMRASRRFTLPLRREVERLLREEQWSPQQISGYMRRKGMAWVSHETIYAHIRFDRRCGGTLWRNCRHMMKHWHRPEDGRRIPIRNRTGIEERPPEADGTRFGDWEMDTIVGKDGKGAILTLVERNVNMLLMERLPRGKNARELADAVIRLLLPYRKHVLTITTDNGTEFAEHERITKALGAKVYFAHPYSSWEKGAVENMNKLIRQYIPKQTDFSAINDAEIKMFQYKINRRPRKKLNFRTPLQCFFNFFS